MSNILKFAPLPNAPQRAAAPDGPARIIIFPGVRYERLTPDTSPACKGEGGGRRKGGRGR